MKTKIIVPLITVMILAGGLTFWKYSSAGQCSICNRAACKILTFGLKTEWKLSKKTCCPRCALHYMKLHPGATPSYATDFNSGDPIRAKEAVYVEGSDAVLCHNPDAVRDEIGGSSAYTAFDRCLPSVLAFKTRKEAKHFIQKHGGRTISWSELSRKI